MDADPPAAAIWLVDKPAGPTSHDVVAGVRRRLGGRRVKVGHAGTLDPFATGLLLILVGRATRLARYLSGLDKGYLATVRLGATSATGDPEGPVVETGAPAPAPERVAEALPGLLGRQRQRVPMLAAVKVDGERLYRRARRGEEVAAPEREIEILGLRMVGADPAAGTVTLDVRCSKGTYLRQLATDLGERLGCGGYCAALRRTAVGGLSVDDAVPPDRVTRDGGIGLRAGLAHLPARPLSPEEVAAVLNGRPVSGAASGGPVALVAGDRVVAVAHPDGEGALRPAVVLG